MSHRTGVLLAIAGMIGVSGAVAQTDEATLEVRPERVTVDVAPVDVAIGGMPPLDPLEADEEILTVTPEARRPVSADLPLPELPRAELAAGQLPPVGRQVFFNATLGGGSANSVLGNINLFRLGDGPQFRLGYDHRGTDGFNFNQPGTGYFEQANALDAWLEFGEDERLGLELEGGYRDRRFGLQRRPLYYAAETRDLTGAARLTFRPETRVTAGLDVALDDRRRILAVTDTDADSPNESHGSVAALVDIRAEWPRFSVEAAGDLLRRYESGTALEPVTAVGATLGLEGVPFTGLTLRARAGARYRVGSGVLFPVDGGLEFAGGDRLTIDLAGGIRMEERSIAGLWQDYPAAALDATVDGRPPVDRVTFARGDLGVSVIPGILRVGGSAEWSRHSDRLLPDRYDESIALYPVRYREHEPLDIEVSAGLTPLEWLSIDGAWLGRIGDRRLGTPGQELAVAATMGSDRVEGDLSARTPLGETAVPPRLDGEFRVSIARDVLLTIFATDVLAPLEDRGRTPRLTIPDEDDPFILPGFELGAAIRVSF